MSSAYRKPHTGWQHAAAFTGAMNHVAPARADVRDPSSLVLGLLAVAVVTLIGTLGHPMLSSSASSVGHAIRGDQHGALGVSGGVVPDGATVFDDRYPAVAKLDPALLGALRRAATDAADDGVELVVNSGWRSPAYQEELLDEAVSKYGSREEAARWVATPATSAHVWGGAVDIGHSDATAWLSRYGARYGLCLIYGNEPWHYELRPEAVQHGCPQMYADPTHDPRMQS